MTRRPSPRAAVAAIVGSAFQMEMLDGLAVTPIDVTTPWGPWTLHHVDVAAGPAYVSFRHGYPHRLLPNQVPYRAQAWALKQVGCSALLVTSSVGILDAALPLYQPLLVGDLLTLDNRLPGGEACTMFPHPDPAHGHLVLNEGLFSIALTQQVAALARGTGDVPVAEVVFGYAGGPRTKTPAENRMWRLLGAQVNSMTVGPEVVLANELEIPCAAAVVGHKYSVPDIEAPPDEGAIAETLVRSRSTLGRLVRIFLEQAVPVAFGNHLFRFQAPTVTEKQAQ